MAGVVNGPLFTVLMPVYNAGKYLSDAIESVLGQTESRFEFLIINDGSTDNSLETIKKYAGKDPRIHYITRSNKGLVETLTEGLRAAGADIIVRMDADDISLPERFEKQYQFLMDHPDHVVVGCQIQIVDEAGQAKYIDARPTSDTNVKLFLAYGCAMAGAAVMFRRAPILEIGGYRKDTWPAEDYDCWVRIVESNPDAKIANLSDALYLYRENNAGISLSNKAKQVEATNRAGQKFRQLMLKRKWRHLSYAIHKGWFMDIAHIPDEEQQEQLRRIYYTIQTWFINDEKVTNPLSARLDKFRLESYTKRYNPQNEPYLYNQPTRHELPRTVEEQ